MVVWLLAKSCGCARTVLKTYLLMREVMMVTVLLLWTELCGSDYGWPWPEKLMTREHATRHFPLLRFGVATCCLSAREAGQPRQKCHLCTAHCTLPPTVSLPLPPAHQGKQVLNADKAVAPATCTSRQTSFDRGQGSRSWHGLGDDDTCLGRQDGGQHARKEHKERKVTTP